MISNATNRQLETQTISRTRSGYTASPRMIWNGGFWDGVYDREYGLSARQPKSGERPLPAWSPMYSAGYAVGYEAARNGRPSDNSTPFWQEWIANQTNTQVERMLRGEEGHPSNPATKRSRRVAFEESL